MKPRIPKYEYHYQEWLREERDRLEAEVERLTKERDEARHRARRAAQMLIEEIGAPGPESVDETATRAVEVIKTARAEVERLRVNQARLLEAEAKIKPVVNSACEWRDRWAAGLRLSEPEETLVAAVDVYREGAGADKAPLCNGCHEATRRDEEVDREPASQPEPVAPECSQHNDALSRAEKAEAEVDRLRIILRDVNESRDELVNTKLAMRTVVDAADAFVAEYRSAGPPEYGPLLAAVDAYRKGAKVEAPACTCLDTTGDDPVCILRAGYASLTCHGCGLPYAGCACKQCGGVDFRFKEPSVLRVLGEES